MVSRPLRISIHALLAESDADVVSVQYRCQNFYPRSPCGERPAQLREGPQAFPFLSTLSLRRATIFAVRPYDAPIFLSTLSLRRATPETVPCGPHADISIHALLAESDGRINDISRLMKISIHALLAESDSVTTSFQGGFAISIHALLAESDLPRDCILCANRHFYPRSPCGERRSEGTMATSMETFLSTLSLRRATDGLFFYVQKRIISIHALLAESDDIEFFQL